MDRIVACGLIKHGLVDLDRGRFALHNQDPFSMGIEDNNISAFLQLVQRQTSLDLDQRLWKVLFLDKELYKVLSNPFFRSQHKMFLADLIENEILTFL